MNTSNFSTIRFPSFGIEMNPPRGFSLFGLDIRFYGVIIAVGLLLAIIYGLKRGKQFGLIENDILDGVLWIVPFAILCTRAYYCIFSWEEFADNPIRVLYIWEGGLAIYGGVIGAILGVVVFCAIKRIHLCAVLDIMLLAFLLGQGIGRWGNFFNREAFGAETDSFFRMGLFNTITETYQYYHPTFLYESLWNLTGFVLLHFLSKKRQYDGQIALGYAFWYGLGRTFIEGLRMDSLYWGQFRVSQVLAAVTCFASAVTLVILAFCKHDKEKLFVHRVAARALRTEPLQETPAISEETPLETAQSLPDTPCVETEEE